MAGGNIQKAAALPESAAKTDFENLVDNATIRADNVTNAMCNSAMDLVSSKLLDLKSGSDQDTLASDGSNWTKITNGTYFTINFIIDGGGEAISTGIKGDLIVDVDATILSQTMLLDQASTTILDIWVDTYAGYPPEVAETITASAKPETSAAIKDQDATLTGWTKTISAGETIRFNVDANDAATRILIALKCKRT